MKVRIQKSIYAILIMIMGFACIASSKPKHVQAEISSENLSATYLNITVKCLYLGEQDANTYNFNIIKKEVGAIYSWYVTAEKGNPDSITINKKTGDVTAIKVGTAYIRCKITHVDGTVLRPEAKVIVRNNITQVEISNLPKNLTIKAGIAKNFNRKVLATTAGKDITTQGITRWEIAEDTAGVENVTTEGVVFPIKEGKFKIRAISFQNKTKYEVWLENKEVNKSYITAASDWHTIEVAASKGVATVSNGEQLNKSLLADNINQITLITKKALAFTIPVGDYSKKTLIVDAVNADVNNHGVFKKIVVNAIRDNTWIEYADGNIVYLKDDVTSFTIEAGAQVKRIVIDRLNSKLNLEIRGTLEQITVTQLSQVNITGSGGNVPVTVENTAGGSTITTSMPLDLELNARTEIVLNDGAEETTLNKSESSVIVKIENNTDRTVTLTTGNNGGESITAGGTVTSDSSMVKLEPKVMKVTVSPKTTVIAQGDTRQLSALVTVVGGAAKSLIWSTSDENNKVSVSKNGLVTVAEDAPVAEYTITVKSTVDANKSDTSTILVVDPLTVTDIYDHTAGESFDISGAISGYKDEVGNIMADDEYSVTVRNNDKVIFGPTMVAFEGGAPTNEIAINITTIGEYALLLQVGDTQDTLDVTINPAAPYKYSFISASDNIKAGEQASFRVQLQDEYENPITVHDEYYISVYLEDILLLSPVIIENGEYVDFDFTYDHAGTYTITVDSSGIIPTLLGHHELIVVPNDIDSVTISRATHDFVAAGENLNFSIAANDEYGNLITSDATNFTWTNAVNGVFRKTQIGAYNVSAAYSGVASAVDTVVVIPAGEAVVTAVDLAGNQTAGESFDISGLISNLKDEFGNLATNGEYSVTVRNNGNIIYGPTLVAFVDGEPITGININMTTAGEHILLVQVGAAQDTIGITINPAAPNKYGFISASDNVKAGEQASYRVQLQDEYGNPITEHDEYHISVYLDDILILNPVMIENSKYVEFDFSYNYAGTYAIMVDSSGIIPTLLGHQELMVIPSDVASVTISRATHDAVVAGENLNFSIEAKDEYDNLITSDTTEFAWTNALNGVFRKTLPGSYNVTAEYNGVTSDADTVIVVPACEAIITVGNLANNKTAGELFDISGSISDLKDQYGNLVADGEYSVTVRNKGNIIYGPAMVYFTGGAPTTGITINSTTAGVNILVVQVGAASDITDVTIDPAEAYKFSFLAADGNIKAGEQASFRVQVQDEYGNSTAEHVEFSDFVSVTESLGTLSPGTVDMDENEKESDFTWTHNQTGTYHIIASATGINQAVHEITVIPNTAANLTVADVAKQSIGRPFPIVMSALRDTYGNMQLTGAYHLNINSNLTGVIFEGDVTFTTGAWTQAISLSEEGVHTLSILINNVTVATITVEAIVVPVSGVSIDQIPMTIEVEAVTQLSATLTPDNASNQQVSWSSSNPGIATVSTNGLVTGIGVGAVDITVTTADQSFSDILNIIVEPADITGLGTSASPFIIHNFEGLEKIGSGKYRLSSQYRLGTDIDASPTQNAGYNGESGWRPISTFTGVFDGCGYKISNLKIYRNKEDNVGLFGVVGSNGWVRNLKLENVNILGNRYVGGIAGYTYHSSIEKCYVQGAVQGGFGVGGLVGWTYGDMGTSTSISQCFTTGSVIGSTAVGGLIGQTGFTGIQNTYSTCNVNGNERVGGLVGGHCNFSSIYYSYATGKVTGTSNFGGLVGKLWNSPSTSNSYYDEGTTGLSDTDRGTPRSTKQMQEGTLNSTVDGEEMYSSWDSYYWEFNPATDYPILKWTLQ